jgi:hypothetical protein
MIITRASLRVPFGLPRFWPASGPLSVNDLAPVPHFAQPPAASPGTPEPPSATQDGGPAAFDRVVPPSGNLQVAGKRFWLGTARAGTVIHFWADRDLICLSAGGTR